MRVEQQHALTRAGFDCHLTCIFRPASDPIRRGREVREPEFSAPRDFTILTVAICGIKRGPPKEEREEMFLFPEADSQKPAPSCLRSLNNLRLTRILHLQVDSRVRKLSMIPWSRRAYPTTPARARCPEFDIFFRS